MVDIQVVDIQVAAILAVVGIRPHISARGVPCRIFTPRRISTLRPISPPTRTLRRISPARTPVRVLRATLLRQPGH